MLGILVGLEAEKKVIRPYQKGALIASSGATREGAIRGIERLLAAGATKLLSFGCAAGLARNLSAGSIIVPEFVMVGALSYPVDPELSCLVGANQPQIWRGGLLHSDHIVSKNCIKNRLYRETSCQAVDMESGFVAQAGVPYAVLRVVCDDAQRNLPPLVETILSEGRISPQKLVVSLLSHPSQLSGVATLALDAARARREMRRFLRMIS